MITGALRFLPALDTYLILDTYSEISSINSFDQFSSEPREGCHRREKTLSSPFSNLYQGIDFLRSVKHYSSRREMRECIRQYWYECRNAI
jgi:hypothetical protein